MPRSMRGEVVGGSSRKRSQSHLATLPKRQKRQTTLYDAVAGRVSSVGFLPTQPRSSKNRDTLSSSTVAVTPEEALFRRKGAPERYEESDIYWADRNLKEEQTLPESDLLKAIHTYASDFYGRATMNRGAADFESLDETALLGLGILLEEMAEHVLGETGDLAFVEGEEVEEQDRDRSGEEEQQAEEEKLETRSSIATLGDIAEVASGSGERPKRKKRKIQHETEDMG